MIEGKPLGVERDAAGAAREPAPVEPVADDRAASRRQLQPQLMPPTG
jgi:hypothetical protein